MALFPEQQAQSSGRAVGRICRVTPGRGRRLYGRAVRRLQRRINGKVGASGRLISRRAQLSDFNQTITEILVVAMSL